MTNEKTEAYLIVSDNCPRIKRNSWFYLSTDYISGRLKELLATGSRFNSIIFDKIPSNDVLKKLFLVCNPYTVFYTSRIDTDRKSEYADFFFKAKQAKQISMINLNKTMKWVERNCYSGQYGSKLDASTIQLNPHYNGSVEYNGFQSVELSVSFGENFAPLIAFGWGINGERGKRIKIWLDYEKVGDIEVRLNVYTQSRGNTESIKQKVTYNEYQLKRQIELLDSDLPSNMFNFSIDVKGSGKLIFRALHYRWSRQELGEFLPGGKRLLDSHRQELFYYFHPGNLKGPLNIYFSGWRQAEGFEGFHMMSDLGSPFLLFSDTRLEGGCFFRGSTELESKVINVVYDTLQWLNLTCNDLIVSGLSMGSYAAIYYGSKLHPHSIIVGKPIFNLEHLAKNESKRFGIFPTSLDILGAIDGNSNDSHSYWNNFISSSLDDTRIMIAYMQDDDYDSTAYKDILRMNSESSSPAIITGRGFSGRHNDDTSSVVKWFTQQFKVILKNDFKKEF
ncbi:accessory Sec system protein Asp2 [Lactiplantibacillus plantarum]|uniref:accessory Sec system protein Asp2 n=1 Tax=Lactiplantibacillus plantarum TaxID=1590 RepID=UPI0020055214|nr:accessory Sec system protein Asp2 [Lactiplantibacillus plantarum]MCK6240590.1 accessory Sec system protein Asp2 [Lactiplantibacillus plantarum]